MRLTTIFGFAFLMLLASCSKDKISSLSGNLDGEWKLVTITDKSTATTFFRPGASGDVTINFSGDNFSGKTLRNVFSNGSFTLKNDIDIVFGDFAMTKVMEDDWGGIFITVLRACMLQSLAPCAPSKITLQGNKLIIECPLRYDLTLMRV
ncbi:MAG: hypothetical protein WDN26_24385 [Chitinophagaceae bacterium]